MDGPVAALAQWITDVIESTGYLGVALLVALENLFPPIPSEVVLPLAGFLAGREVLSFPGVVLAATAGSTAGALVLYLLGRWLGAQRLRGLLRSHGHLLLLGESDLDKATDWFQKHGGKAVLVGRLVPTVRSLISIPAGVTGMHLLPFVLYTAIGSGVWNLALAGLGWTLGDQWGQVRQYTQYLEWAVIATLAGAVVWFLWKRRRALGA
jgi:membrane protein DedA with SNARE-associated domain